MGGGAAAALRARLVDPRDPSPDRAASGHDPPRAQAATAPPVYRRAPAGSKLDPFKDEIHRLLREDPRLPGQRVRELIAPLGFEGGKTIVDDYLREVRPLFAPPPRTFQRTVYRPGEVCQFDLWEPRAEVPVGHGQTRRAWVVVACLGYSRAGAGALIFSKQTPDLLAGIARCLWSLGALPETLVWDRQAGMHGRGGRPSEEFAAFCGQLKVDWRFCAPADPQAKGVVERLQDFIERSFEPGRAFANELDFQLQLDTWFAERANVRHHKTLRCRPDRPAGRGTRGDGAAARRRRRTSIGAGCSASRPTRTCALTPATTRSTPALVGRRVEVARHRPRGAGGRAGHRRARLPPSAQLRQASHDHRSRARASAARRPRRRRAGGRDPAAWSATTR